MSKYGRPHPLDRPVARLVAVAVALTAAGSLAAIHRDDLAVLLAGPAAVPDDPLSRCIAGQHTTIDKGVADGVFRPDQATLFKQRAEALCRSTVPR